MDLPIYDKNAKKGEDGLTIVKTIVQDELNWVFRKNRQEDDFGIDAYFDVIKGFGQVTGKTIAVQIKTGSSYFKEPNEFGWVYRGEMKHLNYYLNHDIPVVIVIVDENTKTTYWEVCIAEKTIKAGENWKITIPSNKVLSIESKKELLNYISPITDYVSQLEHFWQVNKMLIDNERILFIVGRDEILSKNYSELISAFSRLEVNTELIKNCRGKIDVSISGYDNDPRELFEIPEVMEYVREIFRRIDTWIYFLAMDKMAHFLKVLFIAHTKFKRLEPGKLEYEKDHSSDFIYSLFDGLNRFCDKHNISDEINIEQCDKVMNYFTDGEWGKEKNKKG